MHTNETKVKKKGLLDRLNIQLRSPRALVDCSDIKAIEASSSVYTSRAPVDRREIVLKA